MNQKKGTKKIKDLSKMRITVKLFVVLAFAGALLSGYGAAVPGGKTTSPRRNCPNSFTDATVPPTMQNYFTSGICKTVGSAVTTWTGWVGYDSCCVHHCTYKRSPTEVLLPNGFQQCTYYYDATKGFSSICVAGCPSIVKNENPIVVFTCPSTGCY